MLIPSKFIQVVEAVHDKGSKIVLQIAAIGRMAIPSSVVDSDPDSLVSVSASDIPVRAVAEAGGIPPRPLSLEEIQEYINDFARVAEELVTEAGFDGIELHGANGTLVDQFLQDVSNKRTDAYGGSIENRSRFALEIIEAITKRIGQGRTGLRISPWNKSGGNQNKSLSTDQFR